MIIRVSVLTSCFLFISITNWWWINMKMTCCQWPILLHFQLVKKIFMLWTQVCAKPAASGSPSWNFWGCRVMMQGCAHLDGKGVIRFQEVIILCLQVRFCLWQICNISSSCYLDIIMQSYSRVLVGVLESYMEISHTRCICFQVITSTLMLSVITIQEVLNVWLLISTSEATLRSPEPLSPMIEYAICFQLSMWALSLSSNNSFK